jgi:hypothetical protein
MLLIGLVLLASTCGHRGNNPSGNDVRMFNFEPTGGQPVLGRMVVLEAYPPRVLTPGVTSRVTYELKNVSAETLHLCIDVPGVSTWTSSQSGAKFPSTLYGVVFDARCYTSITLSPGEVKVFTERLVIPTTFPTGPATLHGTLVLTWPERGLQEVLGTTSPLQIDAKIE